MADPSGSSDLLYIFEHNGTSSLGKAVSVARPMRTMDETAKVDNIASATPKQHGSPAVLFVSHTTAGHFSPILQIAEHLGQRGYDVWYLNAEHNRQLIEDAGLKFIPMVGRCSERGIPAINDPRYPEFRTTPKGMPQAMWYIKHRWIALMPSGHESIKAALTTLRKQTPGREVVILCDCFWPGLVPLKLGAALPDGFDRLPKTMGINVCPPFWTSIDSGPPFMALEYNHSASARERTRIIAQMLNTTLAAPLHDAAKLVLESCGAFDPLDSVYRGFDNDLMRLPVEASFACHDTTLQMCIPSLEYPASDFPPQMKFGGTLPPRPGNTVSEIPPWLQKAISAAPRKKIIAVSQGTVALDYSALTLPVLQGLAGRSDVLVVATLGARGASLPADHDWFPPSNAVVVDYMPYSQLLAHADVFITNGGYGVFSNALAYGVPLVMCGDTEEKAENANRAAHAGLGINLKTGTPSPEEVTRAVEEILSDEKWKSRAMELKAQAEEFDSLKTVEDALRALFE